MAMRVNPKAAAAALVSLGVVTATGCASSIDPVGFDADTTFLSVVAASTPHAEILHHLADSGAIDGIDLQIINLTVGEQANTVVADGNADLNYFQHIPYLREWQGLSGDTSLTNLGAVHIEPLVLYSRSLDSISELPDGARVLLPNSGTNLARGLLLLEEHGLITLPAGAGEGRSLGLGLAAVLENPRNLELHAVDDFLIAQALDDGTATAGLISGSVAMEAGLSIAEHGLLVEQVADNPYASILVGTADTEDRPEVQELIAALTSPETEEWITRTYGDAVISVNQG